MAANAGTPLTLEELKHQRRWVLWKRETVNGRETKVPYQPNGRKAMANNPATWSAYAECDAVRVNFSGIGIALGEVDGIYVFGVDIDKCCDAAFGKFTPETRQIVIELDTYGEYSPSGTGCHLFCVGEMPDKYRGVNTGKKGDAIVRSIPGCKQIELKSTGFYFTFTARHLPKTPADLMPRQAQINALCDRIAATPESKQSGGLIAAVDQDEKFRKLMAGDFSDYNDDMSRADLGLLNILARKYNNDIFKMTEAWLESPLYREKLERTDYRSATILKAIKGEPTFQEDDLEDFKDNGVDEYLVNALSKDHEGWFPLGEVSLVGGPSGTGKTYWTMNVLEKCRGGKDVWGHTTQPRDYRVLMMDRGVKAMRRTLDRLGVSTEARSRVIRVTSAQHTHGSVATMAELTERDPGVSAWFIEGLDLWLKEAGKLAEVGQALDELQRLATRRNVAIIASVGSSKEKTAEGKDTERYHGRDTLFGSVAWGRKAETIVLINKTNNDPIHDDCPRQYNVLVRNGRSEHFWMAFKDGELVTVERPEPPVDKARSYNRPPSPSQLVRLNVLAEFKPGDRILYSKHLGASDKTFYKCLRDMEDEGSVEKRRDGSYYRTVTASTTTTEEEESNVRGKRAIVGMEL